MPENSSCFFSMTEDNQKSDVVIIGGVACGPKTAATLARRNGDLKITLFQKEKDISYGSCGFPYLASGDIESFDQLTETSYGVVRDVDFFKKSKGFNVIPEAEVVEINRTSKKIRIKFISDGSEIEHGYDKLVIATGANPVPPPFPVAQSDRIKPFTRPGDVRNFKRLASAGQIGKALIVGGGFIGCELAEATGVLWGIETVLVEKENQLLPYVLDSEMAVKAERELKRQNVEVLTGETVTEIKLDDDGNPVVVLKKHDPITVDYVFLCLGVRPEVTLAQKAGLKIGPTGAIEVNNQMQTSDENIYAGGDCAETTSRINGQKIFIPMGSLANRHGRVIAENIIGNKTAFPGVTGAFLVKIYDLNVGSVGLTEAVARKAGLNAEFVWGSFPDKPDYYPESKSFSLKLVYEKDSHRLLGLQAAGHGDICRRIDVVSALIGKNSTIADLFDFEHGYAPPYSEALDPLHHLAGVVLAREKGFEFISPATVSEDYENAQWLDVREPDEIKIQTWPKGENADFHTIPLNDLRERLGELDKSRLVVIVCKRGPRSYQSAVILRQAGFKKVKIQSGGYQAACV